MRFLLPDSGPRVGLDQLQRPSIKRCAVVDQCGLTHMEFHAALVSGCGSPVGAERRVAVVGAPVEMLGDEHVLGGGSSTDLIDW